MTDERGSMNKKAWLGLLAVAIVAAGFFLYRYYQRQHAAPQPVAEAVAPAAPGSAPDVPGAPPKHHYPVHAETPPVNQAQPLPALADSDDSLIGALKHLLGDPAVDVYLVPKDLIRRVVATVDNLDRDGAIPLRLRPVPAVSGTPVVDGQGDTLTLSPQNSARYQPMIEVLQHADMKDVAGVYLHFYPLFQQAYEQLGYPKRYFNDRLIQVINHLLATPTVAGPIRLVRPNVLYQFADPELEALPYGQKLLIRIGPQNEAIVKDKLRELRAAIIAKTPEAAR